MPAVSVRNPTMKCFEDKMSIFGFSSAQAVVIHDSLPPSCVDFFFSRERKPLTHLLEWAAPQTSQQGGKGEEDRGENSPSRRPVTLAAPLFENVLCGSEKGPC